MRFCLSVSSFLVGYFYLFEYFPSPRRTNGFIIWHIATLYTSRVLTQRLIEHKKEYLEMEQIVAECSGVKWIFEIDSHFNDTMEL